MLGKGEVLGAKYRLVEKIGEGGMGTVWLADVLATGGEVAIKVLHKTLMGDEGAVARFQNEARATATLEHLNICGVIDVGEFETSPFLVMERLKGENLADTLTRERALEPRRAVAILLEVLGALEVAHATGILHRDLKPENVFLARDGERTVAKILDFGVAKFIGDDAARVKMTRTGALVGTPAYMSPEQALGLDDVDVRSDVWATGVMLYEMLAGKLPYDAANYNAMLVKIATERPRPIEDAVPGIDSSLAQIVQGALARDRSQRFPNAREMSRLLRAWLDGEPIHITTPRRVAMPTPHTSTTPMSWAETHGTNLVTLSDGHAVHARRSWLMPVVLTMVLGFAGVIVFRGSTRPSGTEPGLTANPAIAIPRAVPPVRENCELQLDGLPPGARVEVNGREVQMPAHVRRGQPATLTVTAPGFDAWTQTFSPTDNLTVTYGGRATPVPVIAPAVPAVANPVIAIEPPATAVPQSPSGNVQRGGHGGRNVRHGNGAPAQPVPNGPISDPGF